MTPFFSIIIPVYNAERYLRACLDSILVACEYLSRVEHEDYVEIICVDDGSTDNSARVLDEYSEKESPCSTRSPRLKIIHKQNEGVSVARNTALKMAQGEYITWLDADDLMAPNHLEAASKILKRENPDLFRFYYFMGKDDEVEGWRSNVECEYTYETITEPAKIFHWGWGELNGNGMVWLWFAKRELLNGLRFRPGLRVKEDCLFSSSLIPRIKKFCVSKDQGVFYRQLSSSAMHTVRKAQDCINVQHALLDLWNEQKEYAAQVGELEYLKYRLRRCSQNDFLDWVRMRDVGVRGQELEVRKAYMAMRNSGAFSRRWAIDYRYRLALPLYELTGWLWPIEVVNKLVKCYRSCSMSKRNM